MNLFTRILVLVVLAILASVSLVMMIQVQMPNAAVHGRALGNVRGLGQLVDDAAARGEDVPAAVQRLETLFGFSMKLRPPEQVPAKLVAWLEREGQRSLAIGGLWDTEVYFVLDSRREFLVVGPLPTTKFPALRVLGTTILVGFTVAVLAAWLLVRPLARKFRILVQAATDFSNGRLDTRVECRGSDEIDQVGSAFNEMAARIQALLDKQKHLLQAVSHEFRTPTARIRFDLALLESNRDPGRAPERIDKIERSLDELEELVAELMEYMRFEDGAPPLERQKIDAVTMTRETVAELSSLRGTVELQQQYRDVSGIWVSRRHFRRVVNNLVMNALRYANNTVRVAVVAGPGGVELRVEDDGPGIPEDLRERIFEPFFRLDSSRSRESGGVGLGLALVERIMTWHHGEVRVEDSPLGGAAFITRWPMSYEQGEST